MDSQRIWQMVEIISGVVITAAFQEFNDGAQKIVSWDDLQDTLLSVAKLLFGPDDDLEKSE